MSCKLITCCDEDDFPESSSQEGNCPVGYYWSEQGQSCRRTPSNALLNEDGYPILNEDGEPFLL